MLGKARCLTPALDVAALGTPAFQAGSSPDAVILAFGTTAIDAALAAEELASEARIAVYDARFAKPVDRDVIRAALEHGLPIITLEDHGVVGGFGTAVLEAAAEMCLDASLITRLGLPDSWVYQDSRAKQLAEVGLDKAGIIRGVRTALSKREQRGVMHMAK
ncbi:MAG: transketolase C-terminal domain-containing protein [Phycisphaerae bacterium]